MEALRGRYQKLDRQRIEAEANLKNATRNLDALKKDAREKYDTDDLVALKDRLAQVQRENEEKRAAYQQHLEEIEAGLAAVEAAHRQQGEPRP